MYLIILTIKHMVLKLFFSLLESYPMASTITIYTINRYIHSFPGSRVTIGKQDMLAVAINSFII